MAADTNNTNFLGKGWSFPPAFDITQKTVVMTEKEDDIEKSLQILLTTKLGERIMEPKYGCNMDDLVFEALDTAMSTLIKDKIKTAILYFEPRIDAKKIELNATNDVEGMIIVEIEYVVRATNSRFNFVYPFYRIEGTELNLLTTDITTGL